MKAAMGRPLFTWGFKTTVCSNLSWRRHQNSSSHFLEAKNMPFVKSNLSSNLLVELSFPIRSSNPHSRRLVRMYCSRQSTCLTFITSFMARFSGIIGEVMQRIINANADKSTFEAGGPLWHGTGIRMAILSTSAIAKAHLSPAILTLKANPTFMSGLVAWMVAQASKVVTTYIVYRRLDLGVLVGSGGMPSSHSALCVGLTTSVALSHGVSDALFPVCLGFSLIVMYDATGVRRHAGMQAAVLNMITKDLFHGHPVSEKKLEELLGHTPLQVLAGAFVGIVVGWCCSRPT